MSTKIGPVPNWKRPLKRSDETPEAYRARCFASYEAHEKIKGLRRLEIAREKDEKAKAARTCQICGRAIFAETGVIAHHGYERPGHGWQTASCYGARYPAFERSRDRLGQYIAHCIAKRDSAKAAADAVMAETSPALYHWSKRSEWARREWVTMTEPVTRESFSWVQACHLAYRESLKLGALASLKTFEEVRDATAAELRREQEGWEADRVAQQARYDAWVHLEGAE